MLYVRIQTCVEHSYSKSFRSSSSSMSKSGVDSVRDWATTRWSFTKGELLPICRSLTQATPCSGTSSTDRCLVVPPPTVVRFLRLPKQEHVLPLYWTCGGRTRARARTCGSPFCWQWPRQGSSPYQGEDL